MDVSVPLEAVITTAELNQLIVFFGFRSLCHQVEAVASFRPDVVLLDIGLPILNGLELLWEAARILLTSDDPDAIIPSLRPAR